MKKTIILFSSIFFSLSLLNGQQNVTWFNVTNYYEGPIRGYDIIPATKQLTAVIDNNIGLFSIPEKNFSAAFSLESAKQTENSDTLKTLVAAITSIGKTMVTNILVIMTDNGPEYQISFLSNDSIFVYLGSHGNQGYPKHLYQNDKRVFAQIKSCYMEDMIARSMYAPPTCDRNSTLYIDPIAGVIVVKIGGLLSVVPISTKYHDEGVKEVSFGGMNQSDFYQFYWGGKLGEGQMGYISIDHNKKFTKAKVNFVHPFPPYHLSLTVGAFEPGYTPL